MSGHSKWATIKHKKGALDAKRGKLFTKLIKEITVAARMGGGDPGGNPRLRKVKRGTGELEGVNYEEIVYEGTGPSGTLFLVESMTDNRNRTVAEIRKIFEKHNGVLGAAGTAAWAFERKGIITLEKAAANEYQLMEVAVGAGAEDYQDAGEEWIVTTPPDALAAIADVLDKASIKSKSSSLAFIPKNKKPLGGREAQVALNLAEALDDHDDVQNVFADFDISDEELAALEGAGNG
jgi:YebC/PmpR family DNA-binding regulatory protein